MRNLLLLAVSLAAATAHAAPLEVRVVEEQAFVYEMPDLDSPLLRQLYVGEVLPVLQEVRAPDQSQWYKVSLGVQGRGFVRAEKVGPAVTAPTTAWTPPYLVRDERPLVLGLRVGGETQGSAVNLRYQPFTRLGISLSAGSVVEVFNTPRGAKGLHLSGGIYSAFVLWNFSPIFEVGLARSTYLSGDSELDLTNLFVSFGFEWMFDWGGFIHIYGTYLRSVSATVVFPYPEAKEGNMQVGKFGSLEPKDGRVFDTLSPGFTIGYAF